MTTDSVWRNFSLVLGERLFLLDSAKKTIHACHCHLPVEIQLKFSIVTSSKVYLKDIYTGINTCFPYSGSQTEEKSSFQNIFFKVSEDYF